MPAPTDLATDTPRTTPGRFDVTERPDLDLAGRHVVEAWLVVDMPVDGRCIVTAEGFDDPDHYGARTLRCALVPRSRGHWQFVNRGWRWLLSSWRGPEDEAAAADAWMRRRFAGIVVQVHRDDVTPSPRPLPAVARPTRAAAAA